MRNIQKFSPSIPATSVIGSPMTGAQLRSRLQRPYFLYHFLALATVLGEAGNHFALSRRLAYLPSTQFRQEPAVFPVHAAPISIHTGMPEYKSAPPSANSDWAGKSVAERNETQKRPANIPSFMQWLYNYLKLLYNLNLAIWISRGIYSQ